MISLLSRIPIWLFSRSAPLTLFCLLFVGVLLIIVSFLIGVGDVELQTNPDSSKQVGYVFALNWSFSFVLGFPMLMFFMIEAVTGQQHTLNRLVDRRMIVDQAWQPVGIDALTEEYTRFWRRTTIIGGATAAFSLTYCLVEWYMISGRFLLLNAEPISPSDSHYFYELDWSLAAVLPNSDANIDISPKLNAAFALVNYLLLGLYFSIILTFYGMVILYAEMFNRFSRGQGAGNLRIIPDVDEEDPRRGFSVFEPVFRRTLFATMVGFLLCYFMNLQNLFLRDESPNIGVFVVDDIQLGFSVITKGHIGEGISKIATSLFEVGHILNVTSVWGIVIVCCVLWLILLCTSWILSEVARRSREDLSIYIRDNAKELQRLTHVGHKECLSRLKPWSKELERGMKTWPFGWPSVRQLLWWLLFGIICIVLYRIGLVFVGVTIGWVVLVALGIFRR